MVVNIPTTEGYLTAGDGERVWYETAGTGPDLILSHGLGGNAANKHGPTAAVSDLIAIMDHLKVDRADVVGQSMV